MTSAGSPTPAYEFGRFRLEPVSRRLSSDGQTIPLKPKTLDLLTVLIEHRDRILDKEELMTRLWPDTVVEEGNLTVNVSLLRKALGENLGAQPSIVTVPGRGYRFVAPVREVGDHREASNNKKPLIKPEERVPVGSEDLADQGVFTGAGAAPTRGALLVGHTGLAEAAGVTVARVAGKRRWLQAALLVPALAVTVLAAVYLPRRSPTGSLAVKSLAVLPFQPLVASARDEALEFGLAETLVAKLSNIGQLTVRPTESVLKFAAPGQDPREAARELRVDALLVGSVQRAGDRMRLFARLVDAVDGRVLWADSFDAPWTDIFTVQDTIALQVSRTLALRLTGAELETLGRQDTADAAAYREYLTGRHFWNQRTAKALTRALDHFERAIALDPRYALAHVGVADAYLSLAGVRVLPPKDAYANARAAARRALELDPTLAAAHADLAAVALYHDWDWVAAERAFKRAIQLAPDNMDAHWRYGQALTWVERFDEALREIRRSRELEPVNRRGNYKQVGETLYYARRYDESIAELRGAVLLDPNFYGTRAALARVLAETGAYGEAITEFTKAIQLGGESEIEAELAHAYAVSGQRREATTTLAELIERSKSQYVSSFDIAIVYAGLGDRDQALAWLEKASQERVRLMLSIKVNPRLDPLRADPRFAALVRRIGVFDTH